MIHVYSPHTQAPMLLKPQVLSLLPKEATLAQIKRVVHEPMGYSENKHQYYYIFTQLYQTKQNFMVIIIKHFSLVISVILVVVLLQSNSIRFHITGNYS